MIFIYRNQWDWGFQTYINSIKDFRFSRISKYLFNWMHIHLILNVGGSDWIRTWNLSFAKLVLYVYAMVAFLIKQMQVGLGAEFVVSFSSRSGSFTFKSSWKSHQMTPSFIHKEVLGEKKSSFEWNMLNNERERKKEPQILRPRLF